MGKRKLVSGIVVGAIVGGVVALFNKEARHYAKDKMASVKGQTCYIIKHPSDAVRSARIALDEFNETVTSGAENTINALEQVEQTLDKVIKK